MREMLLDLNVDVVSVNSTCDETDSKITNDSGTSNSSIINADESPAGITDAYSSSTPNTICGLNFDVCENLVTREFFPVDGVSELRERGCRSSSSATSLLRPQWLNLCVPKSGEVKVLEQQQVRKSRRGPRSRSSQYRGVTFYRRTGRWESHIWDCGKQVYLGGFDTAHAAARAYDRAAIKFRGIDADINFSITDYDEDMKQMTNLTKEECVQILRRQSNGLSRGSSKHRALTLNKCGQWEARMGQVLGKKAYDKAATECNGREAVTNFEPSSRKGEVNLDANDEGSGQNLDLNLWISPPSNGPKENFHFADYQLADGKRLKAESAASAPMGGEIPYDRTMASKYLPIWPGMFSGFMPNYEERVTGKREAEVIPLVGFSNWAWQMQGHGMVNPVPLLSTAASSGFSSTFPPFSTSLLPLNSHNNHNR